MNQLLDTLQIESVEKQKNVIMSENKVQVVSICTAIAHGSMFLSTEALHM